MQTENNALTEEEILNDTLSSCKTMLNLLNTYATEASNEQIEDVIEDLYHIGIIYKVDGFSGDIKNNPDGIDSLGADWYEISELNLENLTPFAKFVISKYYK